MKVRLVRRQGHGSASRAPAAVVPMPAGADPLPAAAFPAEPAPPGMPPFGLDPPGLRLDRPTGALAAGGPRPVPILQRTGAGHRDPGLGMILETLKDGVAVVDRAGRLKSFNRAYLRLFGLRDGEISPGEPLPSLLAKIAEKGGLAVGLDQEEAIARRLAAWGTEADRHERRYLENGRVQDIFRSRTAAGDIVAVHVDVTESVERDRTLEMQRLYMERLLANITDGVTLFDAENRVIAYNKRFLELYRVDPAKARWGMPAHELARLFGDLDGLPEAEAEAAIADRLAFSRDPKRTRLERHLADGRILDLRKALLPDGGCVITSREITREREREAALERARRIAERTSRQKSQFLARMSHEVRTPLNGVLGVAALLQRTGLDAEQRALVATIIGSGDMLVRLLDDVLDLSRIEAGRLSLREERFEICSVLRDAIGLIEPAAMEKGLSVLKDPSPVAVPPLMGDPVRIKQIVLNLLGNAVKYTDEGSVTIGLRARTDATQARLRIVVEDTGRGIPEDQRAAIFEAFHQVSDARREAQPGTGLGLSVAKGLVEAMKGAITVEERPEGGSRFTVDLALPRAERMASAAE